MAKARFEVIKTDDGFRWRLFDERGDVVRITPGSVPGLRNRKGAAGYRAAVQAGLKALYEKQQQGKAI